MAAVSLSVSTVKPLGDRVFVKISESEEKTAGGIFFLILQKRSLKLAKLSRLVLVSPMKMEVVRLLKLVLATKFCTASTPVLTSSSVATSTYSYPRKTSLLLWADRNPSECYLRNN